MIVFVLWVDLCHRISEAGVDRRRHLADQALPVARGLTNKAPTWLSSFETSIKFEIWCRTLHDDFGDVSSRWSELCRGYLVLSFAYLPQSTLVRNSGFADCCIVVRMVGGSAYANVESRIALRLHGRRRRAARATITSCGLDRPP